MAAVPPGFIDLSALQSRQQKGERHNVIGMVSDMRKPTSTKSGDLMCTFSLVDLATHGTENSRAGFLVRFFDHPSTPDFPRVTRLGDVMLLRAVRFDFLRDVPILANMRPATQWSVFPFSSLPKASYDVAYMGGKHNLPSVNSRNTRAPATLSLAEQKYIVHLANNYDKLSLAFNERARVQQPRNDLSSNVPIRVIAERRPAPHIDLNPERRKLQRPGESKKFHLIKDIEDFTYVDLCVEVVKAWSGSNGCELYVTDYTENKLLCHYPDPLEPVDVVGRDGDPHGYTTDLKKPWPGPWGHHVLKVVCKSPHAEMANARVEPGQHLRLSNMKIKMNSINMLEGTLWPDNKYPDKLYITILRDADFPEVQDLVERKQHYHAARNSITEAVVDTAKRDAVDKLSKSAAKKKKKRERKAKPALTVNEHVRCSHMSKPLNSVQLILDTSGERHQYRSEDGHTYVLPFVNTNFRAKVRVLDFQPDKLEDFALMTDEVSDSSEGLSIETSQIWEWSFTLLIQDADQTDPQEEDCMLVNVGHEQAQFMFGNDMPDPVNLREESVLLRKLREKMCILWGDLEEQKTAGNQILAPSNLPFECCISEYGMLNDDGKAENILDWERQYMLHGVTIL